MGALGAANTPRFLRLFKRRCSNHDAIIKELLAAGAPGDDDALIAADEWLAGTLLDCLDGESTEVESRTRRPAETQSR